MGVGDGHGDNHDDRGRGVDLLRDHSVPAVRFLTFDNRFEARHRFLGSGSNSTVCELEQDGPRKSASLGACR